MGNDLFQLPSDAFAVISSKGSGIGHGQFIDELAHSCATVIYLNACISLEAHTGFGMSRTEQRNNNFMLSERFCQQGHNFVKGGLARTVEV